MNMYHMSICLLEGEILGGGRAAHQKKFQKVSPLNQFVLLPGALLCNKKIFEGRLEVPGKKT